MSFSKMVWVLFALCWLSAVLALSAYYWRSSYLHEKQKSESAVTLAEQRQQIITNMQQRQREVAALDAKYTQELTDARLENDRLRADVTAGRRQLRISATCHLPEATATSVAVDATRAGLNDTAQRDYFTLRKRIETARSQIAGLQDYIRKVCLAPKD